MNLELRRDIEEWVSEKTRFYQETMYQYFLRIHNFTGVDQFGNSLEVIPVDSMITPALNHNLLPQAVGHAGRIQEVFGNQGVCDMDNQSTQISTIGKPYLKDEELFNAFSLPIDEMLDIFTAQLKGKKSEIDKTEVHIGKNLAFYLDSSRLHDVIYAPTKSSVPFQIINILYVNQGKQPVSSGFLARKIDSPNITIPQDVTPRIRDINNAFKSGSGLNFNIIINRSSGYFLNDKDFKLIFD